MRNTYMTNDFILGMDLGCFMFTEQHKKKNLTTNSLKKGDIPWNV